MSRVDGADVGAHLPDLLGLPHDRRCRCGRFHPCLHRQLLLSGTFEVLPGLPTAPGLLCHL